MTRFSGHLVAIFCMLNVPVEAQMNTYTSNTNLYIVLVSFADTPPYGWSGTPPEPMDGAYTMEDFERLFGEGTEGFGPTDDHTVGDDEELPNIYGSVKDYYTYLSGGRLTLNVDILNPSDEDGYPIWLQLGNGKGHYERMPHEDFFDDAYSALTTAMSTDDWYPDTHDDFDLPTDRSLESIRRSNKLGFVYAGSTTDDHGGLHPRGNYERAQFCMGERIGDDDGAGRFSGIGTNIHEIGHTLDLDHGDGTFRDVNAYTDDPYVQDNLGANFMFWCAMQSGGDGPVIQGNTHSATRAFMYQHQSCPNPFNPFYMKDLGWGTHTEISSSTQSRKILPSPGNYYYVNGANESTLYLEFRPVSSFGKYIQWYRWDEAPGLLLWKDGDREEVRLIPADGRSISNSLTASPQGATSIQVSSSTLFPWLDMISDPFGADMHESNPNGLRTTIASMEYYKDDPTRLPATISLVDPENRRTPDWATDASHFMKMNAAAQASPSYLAVRNVHIVRTGESGYAVANIYKNYLGGELARSGTLSGDIYVGDDVIIGADEVLTIASNSTVYFLSPKSQDSNSRCDFVVEDDGRLEVGHGVTFRMAREEYTNDDGERVEGPSPQQHGLTVKAGGQATLNGLTIYDGTHSMKGEVEIDGDLSVGDGSITVDADRPPAALVVDSGSELVVASKSDAASSGGYSDRVEIFVQNGSTMTLKGGTIRPETLTGEEVWRGVVVKGTLNFVGGATFKSGSLCLHKDGGSVPYAGTVSFENCGMIAGPRSKSVREDDADEEEIGVYSEYSQLANTGRWRLLGTDADDFELEAIGVESSLISDQKLSFESTPDYEMQTDRTPTGGDNIYEVTVMYEIDGVGLPTLRASQDVVITVTDKAEPESPSTPTIEVSESESTAILGLARLKIGREQDIDRVEWRLHHLGSDGSKVWDSRTPNGTWDFEAVISDDTRLDYRTIGFPIEWSLAASTIYTIEGRVRDSEEWYSEVYSLTWTSDPPIEITVAGLTEVLYYTDWMHDIGTYRAENSEGSAETSVEWSAEDYAGDRHTFFNVSSDGVLTWAERPSFSPMDQNTARTIVYVTATSPVHTTSKLKVDVTYRMNQEGSIALTFADPPRIGTEMTASLSDADMTASLSDADNEQNVKWSWHRVDATDDSDVELIYDGKDQTTVENTYTPVSATDLGHRIRVTAHYDDDHSDDIDLSETTVAVVASVTGGSSAVDGTATLELEEGTTLPRVNYEITARLEDENYDYSRDGGRSWAWERINSSGDVVETLSVPVGEQWIYTPVVEDIGHRIRATVTYSDFYAPSQSASATTRPVVADNRPGPANGSIHLAHADPPRANQEMEAEVRDEDGVRNVNWAWVVFTPPSDDSNTGRSDPNHSPTFTPGSGDVGKKIRVTAVYDDRHSTGIVVTEETGLIQVAVGPPRPNNNDPLISGDISIHKDEGYTGVLDTYIGSDPDTGDRVSWLEETGTDAALFDLDDPEDDDDTATRVSRTLSFASAPDYEHKSTYEVTLNVSDSSGARGAKLVTVHLNNLDEPGSVTFPSIPKTCVDGIRATLHDPDGGISFVDPPTDETYGWEWAVRDSPPDRRRDAPAPVSVEEVYVPKNTDAGKTLHVTVKYEDAQGPSKTASGSSSTIEANVPRQPTALKGVGSPTSIKVLWTAPDDCGKDLTRYEYRYREVDTSSWTTKILRNAEATTVTIPGLANNTTYDIELRASNQSSDSEGYGARASAQATTPPIEAVAEPGPVRNLRASGANGEVTLTWVAPSSAGESGDSGLTGYECRQSPDRGSTWSPDWTAVASPLERSMSLALPGLASCTSYSFEVRARNGSVAGDSVRVGSRPWWSGSVASDTTWSGEVCADGDVTIPSGVTLSLGPATEVRFHPDDGSGLMVSGTLAGTGVTFRSINHFTPSTSDWSGVRVESGGSADLSGATIRDGGGCLQVHPSGTVTLTNTTLSPCAEAVSLSAGSPQLGVALTASLEGVSGGEWQWQSQNKGAGAPAWSVVSDWSRPGSSEPAGYTPVRADLGRRLRAMVRYVPASVSYSRYVQSGPSGVVKLAAPTGFEVWPDHEAVLLMWDDPGDATISHWQHGKRERTTRLVWTEVADGDVAGLEYGGRTRRYIRVGGLGNGVESEFRVRSKASDGIGVATTRLWVTPSTPEVAYGSSSYEALEGGEPVSVSVALSSKATRSVSLPITVTADAGTEPGDFTVAGLSEESGVRRLSFALGDVSRSFTLTANEDADGEDETVSLEFGTPLPAGVRAGTPGSASVTLAEAGPVLDPPVGPGSVSFAENRTDSVATYTLGAGLTLQLGGADADTFRVSGDTLYFRSPPDYERPADTGGRPRDNTYVVGLWSSDGSRSSTPLAVRVTVTDVNEAPVISGPDSRSVPENRDTVATYTATDPEGDRVTWSRTGTDAGDFRISGIGVLTFSPAPNYESAADANGDNEYELTLTATDRGSPPADSTKTVTVTVTNVDEPGVVSVTPSPPKVGQHLMPTLESDPDGGVTNIGWGGWHELDGSSSRQAPSLAQGQRYTVEERVLGGRLVATFTYDDAHGPNKTARDTTDAVQANVPEAPGDLQATAGDEQVTLRWTAAAGRGAEVTEYQYRWRLSTPPHGSGWQSAGAGLSHTVEELTNDRTHTFEVRAVNAVGEGAASDPASATPKAVVRTVSYSASSYVATEDGDTATVKVNLSPAPTEAVSVTVTVRPGPNTDPGDFAAVGLASDSTVSFTASAASDSFQIVARSDADSDDDTVLLGFKELPAGLGNGAHATATVNLLDATLKVVGPASVSVEENGVTVAGYRATDPWDGPVSPVTWSRSGPDASRFRMTDSDTLEFVSEPNYEQPLDEGGDNVYHVNLVAEYVGVYHSAPFPVTVTVTDGNEPGTVTLRPDPPSVGRPVTATLSDPDEVVISPIWSWRRVDSAARSPILTTAQYTPTATDVDYGLRVTASYTDVHGTQSADTTSGPVRSTNRAPVISGSAAVTVDEDSTRVGTYAATDADGDPVTWSRAGADSSAFTIGSSSGLLRFGSAPDYEAPTDADGDSVYSVEVVATDPGEAADTLAVTVWVRNIDEPGTVTFSPDPPRVGKPVTATVEDPDGGVGNHRNWHWSHVDAPRGARATFSTTGEYTPTAQNVDYRLRVTVGYDDAHGPGKSASGNSGPVPPTPCSLSLSASPSGPVTFAENATGAVATYTATATNCGDLDWSPTGDEDPDFELRGSSGLSRKLHFKRPPDFETRSSYQVTVRVTAGSVSKSLTVTVNVQDVNEPPVISGPASPSVPENSTPVATYTATDPEGHSVTWTMSTGGGTFSIGGSSGALAFKSAKDYEALSSYTFTGTIRATDSGSPAASSTQAVTVTVTNVNERGTVTMSPSRPYVGDQATATLTDPDGGITGPTWSWSTEESAARSPPPPTEAESYRYTVPSSAAGQILRASVSYSDVHGPGQSADTTSTGTVRRRPCSLSLEGPTEVDYDENGTGAVGTYTATASHCGTLTWSPVGLEDAYVEVRGSGSSRSLHFHSPPNYETMRSYEVTVTVRSGSESASRTVTVNVQDVNEPPVISGPASPSVPENRTPVATYTATDPEGHSVTWTMSTGGGTFSIGGSSGALAFKSAKDYEALSSYTFTGTIRATDSGSPAASSTQAVTVTVTNVEEPGTVTFSPDPPKVGQPVTASVEDPDGGVTRHRNWNWSRVDAPRGARAPLSTTREYTPTSQDVDYRLRASVTYDDAEGSGKSATGTSGPVPRPPCSLSLSASKSSPVSYLENGTGAVGTYTATASHCGTLTWSPVGLEDAYVELRGSGSSRSLYFHSPPNYETMRSYEVTVTVRSGSESASRTVTVNVQDVNEPPVISGPASPSVPENRTPVATYTATDPEGHSVTWTMSTGGGTFSIGGSSGALAFKSAKDYEALSSYTFTGTIRATDSGSPAASSTKAVTATVTNIDETGTVTFSPDPPKVGQTVTASVEDPDGGVTRHRNWNWSRVDAPRGARAPLSTTREYTPTSQDVDYRLRASVTYDDAEGSGKSATGDLRAGAETAVQPVAVGVEVQSGELPRERHRLGGHLHGYRHPLRRADLVADRGR